MMRERTPCWLGSGSLTIGGLVIPPKQLHQHSLTRLLLGLLTWLRASRGRLKLVPFLFFDRISSTAPSDQAAAPLA